MAEMLIDGGEALHQCLLATYNRMLFPAGLSVGLITAVFKSGDVNDKGNYREITVTPVLAKLVAMLSKARMTEFTQGNHLRAEGQAGFRLDYRTLDGVFIMQQLIEHYAQKSYPKEWQIFACFVDFRKAFNTVDRYVLWQVLWDIDIRGRILSFIKAMYECDSAAMSTKEGISEVFTCYPIVDLRLPGWQIVPSVESPNSGGIRLQIQKLQVMFLFDGLTSVDSLGPQNCLGVQQNWVSD